MEASHPMRPSFGFILVYTGSRRWKHTPHGLPLQAEGRFRTRFKMTLLRTNLEARKRSNIDALHGFLRIARARGGSARRSTIQAREIVHAQFHLYSADVLLEIVPAFCARDGHDIIATSQKPRQRKLRRRAVLFRSEFL